MTMYRKCEENFLAKSMQNFYDTFYGDCNWPPIVICCLYAFEWTVFLLFNFTKKYYKKIV